MTTGRINQVARDERAAAERDAQAHTPTNQTPTPGIRHWIDATHEPESQAATTERISPEVQSKHDARRRRTGLITNATSNDWTRKSDRQMTLTVYPAAPLLEADPPSDASSNHSMNDHQCSATEAHRIQTTRFGPPIGWSKRPVDAEAQAMLRGGATVSRRSGRVVERVY